MKVSNESEIHKAKYHNDNYLLLFGGKNDKVLKFHLNNFCYFKISASLLQVLPLISPNVVQRVFIHPSFCEPRYFSHNPHLYRMIIPLPPPSPPSIVIIEISLPPNHSIRQR